MLSCSATNEVSVYTENELKSASPTATLWNRKMHYNTNQEASEEEEEEVKK
jgi:hypothetical protein